MEAERDLEGIYESRRFFMLGMPYNLEEEGDN